MKTLTDEKKTAKLPPLKSLMNIIKAIKGEILDEYQAFEGDETPGIQLTVGWSSENGEWSYQTGDNSYTGGAYHYPIWGVVGVYRRSNSRELAKDIQSQLDEQTW